MEHSINVGHVNNLDLIELCLTWTSLDNIKMKVNNVNKVDDVHINMYIRFEGME